MRSGSLLLSFLFASIATMHGESFAAADPLLTEKSLETFAVEFDGLPLTLPIELKPRVMAQAQAQGNRILKSLEIGNVDFSFKRSDPKSKEPKLIHGWIEGEAFKSDCSDQKEIETIRKLLVSDGQDTIKIQHIVNDKFKGYIVNWSQYSRGKLSGVALDLIDSQKSVCYTFSLAIGEFDGFSGKEIRDAVSPLTDPIRKSFTSYAHADE